MFDELKEAKYFKEITDFKSLIMLKRLMSLQEAEMYLKPKRASMIRHFCEYT